MVVGVRCFVSYLNDDNQTVTGYFDIIEQNQTYIKIISGSNYLTIPFHRVLKIKEAVR